MAAPTRALLVPLIAGVVTSAAMPDIAADRLRPGNYEQTVTIAGKTMKRPQCISQSDADAINGDAKSIRTWLERLVSPVDKSCAIKDVNAVGNKVTVTKSCPDGRETVGTTTYFGDRYETVNSGGIKSEGRWTGPCKQP